MFRLFCISLKNKIKRIIINCLFSFLQKLSTAIALRSLSAESTDLRKVMAEKIPVEQERIKSFRKQYGGTKVGEVTVDMVKISKFIKD